MDSDVEIRAELGQKRDIKEDDKLEKKLKRLGISESMDSEVEMRAESERKRDIKEDDKPEKKLERLGISESMDSDVEMRAESERYFHHLKLYLIDDKPVETLSFVAESEQKSHIKEDDKPEERLSIVAESEQKRHIKEDDEPERLSIVEMRAESEQKRHIKDAMPIKRLKTITVEEADEPEERERLMRVEGMPRLRRQFMSESILAEVEIDKEADEQWKTTWDFNSMFEVFGILYQGRDDIEPRNQLGRIYMTYPYGIRHMYNVTEVDESRETLTTGDEFDVMDIKSPFPYLHECTSLEFDLFGGAYKGNLAPVFTEGLFDERDDAYFRELILESKDGTGEIILLMGFYSHATIANVELRLINSTGKVVYGTIAASDHLFDDKDLTTSVLFLKDQHQGIAVGTDGLIPLARSRVAVQYESKLCLDICLQVDGQTFLTTLNFPAHKIGLHKIKRLEHLEVTVKWNALKHDSEDDDDDP